MEPEWNHGLQLTRPVMFRKSKRALTGPCVSRLCRT
jgi:hypothetical protein